MICMSVVNVLSSLGKNVPQDIRVASFYDSLYLDMYSPPITALKFKAGELGTTTATLMLDMIEGRDAPSETILGFEMLIRRSTM